MSNNDIIDVEPDEPVWESGDSVALPPVERCLSRSEWRERRFDSAPQRSADLLDDAT